MINRYELQRQQTIVELKENMKIAQENLIMGLQFILMMANKRKKLKEVAFEMMQFEKNTKGVYDVR